MPIKNPLCKELQDKYSPVKKMGKWVILVNNHNNRSLCICDSWATFWGIVYDYDNTIAYDFPECIPEKIREWIRTQYVKEIS